MTRVVVIDEEALFREGLCSILADAAGVSVVGDTDSLAEALPVITAAAPHVVLLGIRESAGVLTAVRRLQQAASKAAVVVVGSHASFELVQELLGAGVRGFLLKNASGQELIAAMRACRDSNRRVFLSLPPEVLVRSCGQGDDARLTDREREVLDLTACAMSNAQIAASLGLSEPTVKRHLRNIFGKLGAVSRIDAVNKARAASLITRRGPAEFF
ncbi:response regulator transcription factor [Streptomyces sp. NPDC057074]|uniref:response regulator transcription factor n=1 Tax=Streptomyces sp. NPDC057074 TaxID=3346015 RepID=UPI0036404C5C